MTVTPHPELDGLYESHGWSFSIDPTEDGDLEYVDRAIAAWKDWRDFLVRRQSAEGSTELF